MHHEVAGWTPERWGSQYFGHHCAWNHQSPAGNSLEVAAREERGGLEPRAGVTRPPNVWPQQPRGSVAFTVSSGQCRCGSADSGGGEMVSHRKASLEPSGRTLCSLGEG